MEEKHMQTTEKEEGIPFFPNHFLKEIIVMAIILAVLSVLATFSPTPMEDKADPFITPPHIKPEWYFLANYKFLQLAEHFSFIGAWAPKVLGIITQIFVALLLIFFPFFDNNPQRHPRRRPFMVTFGILAIVGYGTLLYLGYIK
jgi:quinol-cytochrome oxidoreductase complex cytochrome b subunit